MEVARRRPPQVGTRLPGDVGILQSDQNGVRTAGRLYRSDKSQTVISDLPSEARLTPALWGEFYVTEPGERAEVWAGGCEFGVRDLAIEGLWDCLILDSQDYATQCTEMALFKKTAIHAELKSVPIDEEYSPGECGSMASSYKKAASRGRDVDIRLCFIIPLFVRGRARSAGGIIAGAKVHNSALLRQCPQLQTFH